VGPRLRIATPLDLHRIQDDVYYIPGALNVGVIVGRDSQAVLIDSGIGDRSGRQILQLLEGQGLKPAAILNTHAHGDHTGGNAYIVERTGALVYAPELDAMIAAVAAVNTRSGALSSSLPALSRSRNWLCPAMPPAPAPWMC